MKIDYNILWFEDIPEWYESMIPFVDSYLDSKGFSLIADRKENGENLDQLLERNEFDLILLDYNLKDGEAGDKIIDKVRSFNLYTNVVFYSQDGERKLREILQQRAIEGVYCANREGEDFRDKLFNVIDVTIKKVQDLNNMRGLVIATTSDLDLIMEDIISKMASTLKENELENFQQGIKSKFLDSLHDRIKKIERIDAKNEFVALIKKLEAYHKWRAVLNLCKNSEQLKEFIPILELYESEIIKERNKLAHVREIVDDEGNKILKSSFSGEADFIFNDAKCIEMRSNLLKHLQTFNKIKELI